MLAPELRRGLTAALGGWFDREKRDLPWRRTHDAYAIWLSEVMLQQTRVKTVESYYPQFLRRYPTVQKLARAEIGEVLGAWSGLGYYRRARALHDGAREVLARYGGELPRKASELRSIPGIGPYTAGAIASIAFGAREPVVDGNVARVLARLFGLFCDVRSPAGMRELWALAKTLVPEEDPGRHNESLMELGAVICLPADPKCDRCPVAGFCLARARGQTSELPVSRPKKSQMTVRLLALVARRGERVLLGHRREGGLFSGMWEPPMVEAEHGQRAEALFGTRLGMTVKKLTRSGEQTHLLTHRRLLVEIFSGQVPRLSARASAQYDRFAWQAPSDMKTLGISTLAKKVLLACPP